MIVTPHPRVTPSPKYTVTITGTGNADECYVTINGEKYIASASFKVKSGTSVYCFVDNTMPNSNGTIYHPTEVSRGEYTFQVLSDVQITIDSHWNDVMNWQENTITITDNL